MYCFFINRRKVMIYIIMNLCSIRLSLYPEISKEIFKVKGNMGRPRRKRSLSGFPVVDGFKPIGIPMHELRAVNLLYEEYEALLLCDYEGLRQEEAALRMNISRPTFTRVYEKARRTIATALAEGSAVLIHGGDYQADSEWHRCPRCRRATHGNSGERVCLRCETGEKQQITVNDENSITDKR